MYVIAPLLILLLGGSEPYFQPSLGCIGPLTYTRLLTPFHLCFILFTLIFTFWFFISMYYLSSSIYPAITYLLKIIVRSFKYEQDLGINILVISISYTVHKISQKVLKDFLVESKDFQSTEKPQRTSLQVRCSQSLEETRTGFWCKMTTIMWHSSLLAFTYSSWLIRIILGKGVRRHVQYSSWL